MASPLVRSTESQKISNAQRLADFDKVDPINLFGWDNQAIKVINPFPAGINKSTYTAKWTKSKGQWKGMGFFTSEGIDLENYPIFTCKLYSPVTGKVMVKLFNNKDGYNTKVEVTANPIEEMNKWVLIQVDFSGYKSRYYDKIEIMPIPESPDEIGPFYLDDFILYKK
jgi:hypothetical protein